MFGLESHAPIRVTRGFSGAYLAGGNSKQGTYQIENLSPNPLDTVEVCSRAKVTWGQEKTWMFGDTWKTRTLEVENLDPTPDLRVEVLDRDGQQHLAVRNGEGARSTELTFAMQSPVRLEDGVADSLAELRGDKVVASFKSCEEKLEGSLQIGGQTFLVSDGYLRKA
jgi:hypothetical protein